MKLPRLVGPLFCLLLLSPIVRDQSVRVSGDNSRRLNLPGSSYIRKEDL